MIRHSLLNAPDPALIYRRGDPNDPRLGDVIGIGAAAYAAADIAIVGCPQDEGVRRNRGRPGAALAPDAIRSALMRLSIAGLEGLRIVDLGDVMIAGTLEEIHDRLHTLARTIVADGKRLVSLGGGNDISFADCGGLAAAAGSVLAFNIDAHLDVRADTPRNSGTPYRQLLEAGLVRPEAFYEIGAQPFANSAIYGAYLRDRGATIIPLDELRQRGIAATLQQILHQRQEPAIFWGFDLDVVNAAEAPGVSAPNPLGMSGAELCHIAALAGADYRSKIIEISEVNPAFDSDGRTARLAAVAIWHFLVGMAEIRDERSRASH